MLPNLTDVLGRVVAGDVAVSGHQTDQRIMDAVVDELLVTPLRKLSLEDVAHRAGLTRMTVYRRFGDRDRLIDATAVRELSRFLTGVQAAFERETDPVERIAEAFAAALHLAHSHPLVAHWQKTNPGDLLTLLLTDNGLIFSIASAMITDNIGELAPPGTNITGNPQSSGEVLARLFAALLLIPPTTVDLTDPDQARRLARETLAPLIIQHPQPD